MGTPAQTVVKSRGQTATQTLLGCGLVAGPLFILASVLQGLTRSGFNLAHQPLSFLGLGDLGWVQQANFMLSGILVIGLATGVRRSLPRSVAGILGPLCLLGLSAGLIIAGLYPPDPGFGYPVGIPDGVPLHLTRQSAMHGVGFMLSFGCFALAALVWAGWDLRSRRWIEAAYTLVSAVAALTLGLWPGVDAIALRDLAAAILLFTWITVQAARLLKR